MKKKRKFGLAAILLLGGTAVLWGASRAASDVGGLPPIHTVTVDRGDVSQRVVAHGSLQPGFYPAWKASRLDPIVALRTE